MKNENAHAKKLATLLKRLRHGHKAEPQPARDAVTQIVLAFLEWNASPKAARDAYARISAVLVDNNDLRVSHPHEVVELLGPKYPHAQERAARLHEALQEVFVREHSMTLDDLANKTKKQVRTYLDTLPGMTPYVAAQVMLLSFAGHNIPIDDNTAQLLRREGAAGADDGIEEIASFVERHVKAGDALETHWALQAWSAGASASGSRSRPAASREGAASRPKPKRPAPAKPAKKSAARR